jgi:ribosomal protein S18 acetylase RimI-like enzyme
VLEFATQAAALDYFARDFLPYADQIEQRCAFVVDAGGTPVATATAWWADSAIGRQGLLHWVSVDPAFQGKGLGRAVACKAVSLLAGLEAGRDVYLHTQTWSHVAIRLYRSMGFYLCKADTTAMVFGDGQDPKTGPNEYAAAVEVLRTVMQPAEVDELERTAR